VTAQLGSLPELPANIELEVRKALMEFSSITKAHLEGKEFSAAYGRLAEAFRDCIIHIKPRFVLKDPSDTPVLEISDDDSDASTNTPTPKRSRGGMAPPPPPKRARTGTNGTPLTSRIKNEDAMSPNPSFGTPQTLSSTPRQSQPPPNHSKGLLEPFTRYSREGKGFRTLRQISEDIRNKTKAGMPNVVPDEVYEVLCKQAVQAWNGPMTTFLETTVRILHNIIQQALEKAFGNLRKRLIFKESVRHMKRFLDEHYNDTLAFLTKLYDMERSQLFTIDHKSFERYQQSEMRLLTRYRHFMRWAAFSGDLSAEFLLWEDMSEDQRAADERRRATDSAKMGPDRFGKELLVAGYVRGYYLLAGHRFADTVSLAITSQMFRAMIQTLDKEFYLDTKLGLIGAGAQGSPNVFERLMEEDDQTAKQRERLKVEKEKFEKALKSINELERQSSTTEQRMDGQSLSSGGNDTMDVDGI
jgi:uncharacterized protein YqgV (UPF0045/DUF77 family)